ncbi:TPA: HNH endonuclease [Klebsiella aerogenes]
MAISDRDTLLLYSKSAGLCNYCKKDVLNQIYNDTSNLGERAHIYGKNEGSARYVPEMENNDTYSNLILLCREHHKLIDDHPDKYPVEKLYKIKADHEMRVYKNPLIKCEADTTIVLGIFTSFPMMYLRTVVSEFEPGKITGDIFILIEIENVLKSKYPLDYPFKNNNLYYITDNMFFFTRKIINLISENLSIFQEFMLGEKMCYSCPPENHVLYSEIVHMISKLKTAFEYWYIHCKQNYGV